MRYFVFLLYFSLSLSAFDPHLVTPYPVLGYLQIPFQDSFFQKQRDLLVWYPIDVVLQGSQKIHPWDTFNVASDTPVLPSKKKRPVIFISHGYTGNPHQLSWLIRRLVYQGFIVVGLHHLDLIDGKVHINHWIRAQDIQKMIDVFEKSKVAKFADLENMGLAGFSLGGTTAIWIVGGRSTKLNTLLPGPEFAAIDDYVLADKLLPVLDKKNMAKDWKDSRIKAAFVMAPAWSWIFDPGSLENVDIPVYLIAAEKDSILKTKNNAGFFAKYIPKSIYQEIPGKVDHFIFISALKEENREKADPTGALQFLFKDDVQIDREWIQFQVSEQAVEFFSSIFH